MIDFGVFPTLQTSRLVLREIAMADAADLFAFRSDPEEQKHNDPPLRHRAEAQDLIARLAHEYQEQRAIHWGLTLKGDDSVVGLLGYHYWNRNRIEAHTNTENTSSVRMLHKLGFWQEGTLHEHFYEDGAFHDVSLFVMLSRDGGTAGDVS